MDFAGTTPIPVYIYALCQYSCEWYIYNTVILALGRAFHLLFDAARSRDWYQRATDVASLNGDAWCGLGLAYLDLAESASAKLTSAFGQSAYVAELTAEALAEQGRLTEAVQRYRALLSGKEDRTPDSLQYKL